MYVLHSSAFSMGSCLSFLLIRHQQEHEIKSQCILEGPRGGALSSLKDTGTLQITHGSQSKAALRYWACSALTELSENGSDVFKIHYWNRNLLNFCTVREQKYLTLEHSLYLFFPADFKLLFYSRDLLSNNMFSLFNWQGGSFSFGLILRKKLDIRAKLGISLLWKIWAECSKFCRTSIISLYIYIIIHVLSS